MRGVNDPPSQETRRRIKCHQVLIRLVLVLVVVLAIREKSTNPGSAEGFPIRQSMTAVHSIVYLIHPNYADSLCRVLGAGRTVGDADEPASSRVVGSVGQYSATSSRSLLLSPSASDS
jgi:hypothetical protein